MESYGSWVAEWRAMQLRRACLPVVTSISLLFSATAAVTAQDAEETIEPAPVRVLFVGNSHTKRHGGMDQLVENLVASEEPPRAIDGEILTEGGVTLEYHWNNGARQAIREGGYDTVVLQGYLPPAITQTTEPFLEHARKLHGEATAAGAETVFFMSWPRGYGDWSDIHDVVEAHRTIESELGAPVAPAAYAFELARAERPDMRLVGDDLVHATRKGAYLAAATVYATLFDRSPEGLSYTYDIKVEDAAFLQSVAWRALSDWRAGVELPNDPEG